eukprot:2853444-Lingulodinium_polyedra.AAC.1
MGNFRAVAKINVFGDHPIQHWAKKWRMADDDVINGLDTCIIRNLPVTGIYCASTGHAPNILRLLMQWTTAAALEDGRDEQNCPPDP